VSNGNGVSRGDRNRNARLVRLRALVSVENVIVGIDLADKKQMVVVADHDSKVLARKTFRCRAWDLGVALDWAGERAAAKRFAGVTVHASRLGIAGGCSESWPLIEGCRSCVCSRCCRRGRAAART
jgi:transposase